MSTVALTAETFQSTVTENDLVFVDFWAEWCGPCRAFGPIYEQVSANHPDIVFAKVDTEAEQDLAAMFQVMSIPTLTIIREQVVVFSQPGTLPAAALEHLVEQARALDMDEVRASVAEHQHQ